MEDPLPRILCEDLDDLTSTPIYTVVTIRPHHTPTSESFTNLTLANERPIILARSIVYATIDGRIHGIRTLPHGLDMYASYIVYTHANHDSPALACVWVVKAELKTN